MYKVLLSPGAEKSLDRLYKGDRKIFNHFIDTIDTISRDPYSAKALVGNLKGYYSFRVGDYRIVFEVDKKKSVIIIEKIAHRSSVYK